MNTEITVQTQGKGLVDLTHRIQEVVESSGQREGLVNVFIRHTSASLLIQENADPAVLDDLETFLRQLVPESPERYTHTAEGPDDMPAHIRSALTESHLAIPLIGGHLALGTWQGIYLWEHRAAPHDRHLIITVQ